MPLQTRKELAQKYQCHPETLTKFLRKAGIPDRVRLTPGHLQALERIMNQLPGDAFEKTSPLNFI